MSNSEGMMTATLYADSGGMRKLEWKDVAKICRIHRILATELHCCFECNAPLDSFEEVDEIKVKIGNRKGEIYYRHHHSYQCGQFDAELEELVSECHNEGPTKRIPRQERVELPKYVDYFPLVRDPSVRIATQPRQSVPPSTPKPTALKPIGTVWKCQGEMPKERCKSKRRRHKHAG